MLSLCFVVAGCSLAAIFLMVAVAMFAVVVVAVAVSAFLGSQGDAWDAQKDILCDTLGAICSATLFLCREKRFTR